MPRLITIYETEVEVPQWEYCNEQQDKASKNGDNLCKFVKGTRDERSCLLSGQILYSAYGWIKKCDDCLIKSKKDEN